MLNGKVVLCGNGVAAVNWISQCADYAADHLIGNADAGPLSGSYYRGALCNAVITAEQNNTNGLCLQILYNATDTSLKLYQFAVHGVLHAEYCGDTVTDTDNGTGFLHARLFIKVFNLAF